MITLKRWNGRADSRMPILIAIAGLAVLAAPDAATAVDPQMVTIPANDVQPGGPTYDYEVSIHEVTHSEFAEFLNDAEFHNEVQNPGFGDERGSNMVFRPPPVEQGDVGLIVGDSSDVDALFDISRSLLRPTTACCPSVSGTAWWPARRIIR